MNSPTETRTPLIRSLPLLSALRPRGPSDIWHKSALSAVVASAVPLITLMLLGRMDLAMFTTAGSLCALYAHNLPYTARARALFWVVLGMAASVGVGITAAALTSSVSVLIVVASLLVAAQKAVADATRIGPPGSLIISFISVSSTFQPSQLDQVPGRLALVLAGGAMGWIACMALALLRPDGPQRVATARALDAAAGYLRARPDTAQAERARNSAAAAAHAAWQTLFKVRDRGATRDADRRALEHLVVRAESTIAGPAGGSRAGGTTPRRLQILARGLRRHRPLPHLVPTLPEDAELRGVQARRTAGSAADSSAGALPAHRPAPRTRGGWRALFSRLRPGSPLLPIVARAAVGCALAGFTAHALGIGRPYWAIVTASTLFQANLTLTWNRGLQRVVGTVVGLLIFAALTPLMHTGYPAMLALFLVFQFSAEALIGRNYWMGVLCVTSMALMMTQFAHPQSAQELVTERMVDTLVGAVLGVLSSMLVTNRRAARRIDTALEQAAQARRGARQALADPQSTATTLSHQRDRLTSTLVELREALDTATGEWWQRSLPERDVTLSERESHQTLAAMVRRAATLHGLNVPDQDDNAHRYDPRGSPVAG